MDSSPQEPGSVPEVTGSAEDMLIQERDQLVARAFGALSHAERDLYELSTNLRLAEQGKPYRRVSGAGSGAMMRAPMPDFAVIAAAFDAIERVATLTPAGLSMGRPNELGPGRTPTPPPE